MPYYADAFYLALTVEMEQSNNPARKASNDTANITEQSAGQPVVQANVPTNKPVKPVYNQGLGLEASMWNPKNKNKPRQTQPHESRAASVRGPFRFRSLTLGEEDVYIGDTPPAPEPFGSANQTVFNEMTNQWFAALESGARRSSGPLDQTQGSLTEDSLASNVVGSGPELRVASDVSLLDDNGEIPKLSIPVLVAEAAQAQTTEADPIQPAEASSAQPAGRLTVESAGMIPIKETKEPESVNVKEAVEKIVVDVAELGKKSQGYGRDNDTKEAAGNIDAAASARQGHTQDGGAEITVS